MYMIDLSEIGNNYYMDTIDTYRIHMLHTAGAYCNGLPMLWGEFPGQLGSNIT